MKKLYNWIRNKIIDGELKKLRLEKWDIIILNTKNITAGHYLAKTISNSNILDSNPIIVLDLSSDISKLSDQPQAVKDRIREAIDG